MSIVLVAVLAQSAFPAAAQWSSPQRPPVEAPAKLFVRQSPNILEGTRLSFEYQPGQGYVAGCLQRDAEYLFARGGGVALDLQASQSQETAIYGFRAQFFGRYFTKAFVDTDGFVTFGDLGDSGNQDAASSRPRIAAFLTGDAPGLIAGPESSVEAKLEGGSLVISYTGMRPLNSRASLSFQIVLDQATGDVSITYGRMDFADQITWMTGLSPGSEVRSRTTEIFAQESCEPGPGGQSETLAPHPTLQPTDDDDDAGSTPRTGEDDDGDSDDDDDVDSQSRVPEDAQRSRNSSSAETGTGNDRREGEDIASGALVLPAVDITRTEQITAAMYGVTAIIGGSIALLLACCCCFCILGQYWPLRRHRERRRPRDGQQDEAALPTAAAGMVAAAGDNHQQTAASAQPTAALPASWLQGQVQHQQAPPPPAASAPPLPESERQRVYFPDDIRGGRGEGVADDSLLSVSVITASSDQSSFSLPPGAKDDDGNVGKEVGDEGEDTAHQCVWCLDNPANHCFIPCGHRCVCQEHAELLCSLSSNNSTSRDHPGRGTGDGGGTQTRGSCPICRQPIQASLRIYV